MPIFLFLFRIYLLSVSDFESTSNPVRIGKKREEGETGFSLKLVYLAKHSWKRFGQMLKLNMLSCFSVSSDWIIEHWLDFLQNWSSIFLARLAQRTRSNNDRTLSLGDADLSVACENSVLCCCFGGVL